MSAEICDVIRRECRKRLNKKISGQKADSLFNQFSIVFEADIADAARKIEEGAKPTVKGEIQSSFIAEADKSVHAESKKHEACLKPV
jgi:hypothetical protein